MEIPILLIPLFSPQPTNPLVDAIIVGWIGVGVGAVLSIIAIIVMLRQLYYAKQRQYKEISYSKLTEVPVVSVDTRAEREKVKIYYDNNEVKDMRLVILKVWNSGTLDVKIYRQDEKTEDFETPFWFIFEGSNVIARSILETVPLDGVIEKQDLETYHQNPDPKPNAISLPHCLLKPNQAFMLRVLLTGSKEEIKIEGKLVNCEFKKYKFSEGSRLPSGLLIVLILLFLTVSGILLFTTVIGIISTTIISSFFQVLIIMLVAIIGFYFGGRAPKDTSQ